MSHPDIDRVFAGSIPQLYEQHMVPLIFAPYAEDMAARVAALHPSSVLELAAGTGVVTRRMTVTLPPEVSVVATDLSQPMLDQAAAIGTPRLVEWRQADAMQLPFADESFDVVVCQFGVMFFPDRTKAFAEARRVLRPGGRLLFSVWDRIDQNEFADTVTRALETAFPEDPPRFMARVPHGYHDRSVIAQDLGRAGFAASPDVVTVSARSHADSPRLAAIAYCQSTPLRSEIEARNASRLNEATDIVTEAIASRFGTGAVDGKIQAHVICIKG